MNLIYCIIVKLSFVLIEINFHCQYHILVKTSDIKENRGFCHILIHTHLNQLCCTHTLDKLGDELKSRTRIHDYPTELDNYTERVRKVKHKIQHTNN